MVNATAERLIVYIYTGTWGCSDQVAISTFYRTVGREKPLNLMEFAIDQDEGVNNLDLPPNAKIFLPPSGGTAGGQLTPSKTIEAFNSNITKFFELKNRILERARKLRAKDIRLVFLHTGVGGTGFTVAVRFTRLLKRELEGIISATAVFLPTITPLEMAYRPLGLQDATKNGNTLYMLRTTVAVSPIVDLLFIRIPQEIRASDLSISYLLRALGNLPLENAAQSNPFQVEQLVGISHEKGYPLALQAPVIIRFPKKQLKQREVLYSSLAKFVEDHSKLKLQLEGLQERSRSIGGKSSSIEGRIRGVSGRIAGMSAIRSRRWQRILTDMTQRVDRIKEMVQKGDIEAKDAESDIGGSREKISSLQLQLTTLELLLARLDEELSGGHYAAGLYVISVSPEEREKLGPFATYERIPLKDIMGKLGREKELHDLIQSQIELPVRQLFLANVGIRYPKEATSLDDVKAIVSASENISYITVPHGVQLTTDPIFRDEVVMVAVSMIEFEPEDESKTFEWVEKLDQSIDKWSVPLSKRVSVRVTDREGKPPEEFIRQTKLRGQGKNPQPKKLIGVDEELWKT